MADLIRIIYEDEDILVCHKRAGIATEGDRVGSPDLISMARNYLARKTSDGNVKGRQRNLPPYVATVNRLDKPVEGVIVLAKNKKAATALSEQIRNRSAGKYYYALCLKGPSDDSGTLKDNIIRREDNHLAAIISDEEKETYKDGSVMLSGGERVRLTGGEIKDAALEYEVVKREGDLCLLRIHLLTGRFHQIRAQLSYRGWPILGDDKYRAEDAMSLSKEMGIRNICLIAYKMTIRHPSLKKEMTFEVTPDEGSIREMLGED